MWRMFDKDSINICRYYDPVLKAAATLIGFIVYCMSFYFGIAAVFSCNYD